MLCVRTSSLTIFVAEAWAGRVKGVDCARTAEVEKVQVRVPLMAAMARLRDCCMAGRGASGQDCVLQLQSGRRGKGRWKDAGGVGEGGRWKSCGVKSQCLASPRLASAARDQDRAFSEHDVRSDWPHRCRLTVGKHDGARHRGLRPRLRTWEANTEQGAFY